MKSKTGMRVIASLGLMAGAAHAEIITIDPDNYAAGTNLSSSIAGVGLSGFSKDFSGGAVSHDAIYSAADPRCSSNPADCKAVTGAHVFSKESGGVEDFLGGRWFEASSARYCFETSVCSGGFSALLIDFATPTDFVEISGRFLSDSPLLYAFDASRNFLGGGCCTTPGQWNSFTTGTSLFQSATANISYVIAAGWSSNSSLDVLRYNETASVPAPGTALLFAAGLAGAWLSRRRARPVAQ
jgi:hypothetical protein